MDEGLRNRFNSQAKAKGFRGRGGAFTAGGALKKSYKEFYRKVYQNTPNFGAETAPPLPAGIIFNPSKNTFVQETSLFGKKGLLKKKFRDQGLIKTRDGFVDYEPRNKTISGKVEYVLREFSRPGRQFRDKAGRKKRFKDFKAKANFSNIRYDGNYKENAKTQALKEIQALLDNPSIGSNFELKEVTKISDVRKTFGARKLKQKDIRLKNLIFMIDGQGRPMWEKDGTRCVTNYLNYLYKDYVKPHQLTDEFFDACFDYKWEEEGVSATEISNWCRVLNIRMIALDQFSKVIEIANPPVEKLIKAPTLIFTSHNEHIYPIEDEEKRLSISCSVLQENEVKYFTPKDKEDKEIMKRRVEYVDLEDVGENGRWLFMCRKMLEKNIEVLSDNIEMSGQANLSSFVLDDVKYVFSNGRNCYIRDFYGSRKVEWDGTDISQYVGKVLSENLRDIISKPNQITNQILMSGEIKNRTHIDGKINNVIFDCDGNIDVDYIEKNNVRQFDIKKCHSSILTKPAEDWMIISWRDNFRPFTPNAKGETHIKLGLYYVETKDRTLFIGNNIYSSAIVEFGLTSGIIKESDIKYYLHASQKRDKELFHKTFDDYKKIIIDMRLKDKFKENPKMRPSEIKRFCEEYEFNEFDIAFNKILNNTTSGFLGKTTIKKYETGFSTDEKEAFENLCEYDKEGLDWFRIQEKIEWEGKDHHFHIFGNKKVIQRSEHNLPFYIQILDQQLIKLYDMRTQLTGECHFEGSWITRQDREVLWRNIDCIIVKNPYKLIEKPKQLQEWGDTVEEEINIDRTRFRLKEYRDVDIKWNDYVYNKEWYEVKSITSSLDACDGLMELYNQNQGCCLEGCAGAGKSYVLKQFRQRLGWNEVAVVSFTGIASLNIRGSTFHSTFKLDLNGRIASGTMKHLEGVKAILVDEGSMVSGVLMNVLSIAKKQFNIPIYFFLDWRQLPPIEKTLSGEIMKNNVGFIELCDGNYSKITYNSKYGRYDDDLYNFTEKFDSLGWFFKEGIQLLGSRLDTLYHITATNKKRMELNDIIMEREWNKAEKKLPVKIDPDNFFGSFQGRGGDVEKEEIMTIIIDEEFVECDCEMESCLICNSSPKEEEYEIELYADLKENIQSCNQEYSKFIKPQHEIQPCYFFQGFKAMCMKTNKKLGIVNGEQFELVDWGEHKYKSGSRSYGCSFRFKSLTRLRQKDDGNVDEDKEYLEKFPNYEIIVGMEEFFSYFAPSYAMTCHKVQSQKISEPFTIHEIRSPMVSEEWLYTALTRATKFTDINVSLI
jgi:hypothetical protein